MAKCGIYYLSYNQLESLPPYEILKSCHGIDYLKDKELKKLEGKKDLFKKNKLKNMGNHNLTNLIQNMVIELIDEDIKKLN